MQNASLGIVGALLVLVAGWLGGACGIGGVLMIPALAIVITAAVWLLVFAGRI